MRMYNRRYEKLVREEIEQVQLERLQSTVQRAFKNIPFYQNEMKTRNVLPSDITAVSDIARFGFTSRDDLGYNYPYGLFAVPLRDIVRINSTSGIAGKPTVVGYTKNDLGIWTELLSRLYFASGITADDIFQISFVYGLANWGRGMAAAAENIEASVIPMSFLNPEKEIMIMTDYKTTCLVSTPSHALHLVGVLGELGMDPGKLSLERAVLVSEPMSREMRLRIEQGLGVRVSSGYGIPEAMGPGIAYECLEGRLHVAEDHFIPEIIDPQTGQSVKDGQPGELVITTITTKAYPLIRFRTGDITRFVSDDPCPCGRTLRGIEPPAERVDDALTIRGVKLYPAQIERIIATALGEVPPYVIIIHKVKELDELDILVEEVESLFSDEIKVLERMIAKIRDDLWEILGIRSNVKLVEHVTMKEVGSTENRVIMRSHTMEE
jgi:phenylacetate-CoA ligase